MTTEVDIYLTDGRAALITREDGDSLQALRDLGDMLMAPAAGEGPQLARRLNEVGQLAHAAQAPLAQLAKDYIKADRAGAAALQKADVDAATDFIEKLGIAYFDLLRQVQTYVPGWREVREHVPLLVAQAYRALSMQFKWQLLSYRAVDRDLWVLAARLWNYAEDRSLEAIRVDLPAGRHTTVRREYLKPLMLAISSVESLPPADTDIAERIIDWLSPTFELHRHPAKGCYFQVDVDAGSAPTRYFAGMRLRGGQRFFGPAGGLEKLDAAAAAIAEQGRLPDGLHIEDADLEQVIEVFGHLSTHWGARRPGRREERKRSVALIGVVPGYENLIERVGAEEAVDLAEDPGVEIWKVENESEGGYGVTLPFDQSEWVRVGSVMAVRAADARTWSVGIVRRLAARDDEQRYVGIELLARGARVVPLQPDTGGDERQAVLLPSHVGDSVSHGEVSLLLPAGGFTSKVVLRMQFHGQTYLIEPRMLLENGVDYDLAYYRISRRL